MTHTGTLSSNISELYEVDHGKNINPKMYLQNLDVQRKMGNIWLKHNNVQVDHVNQVIETIVYLDMKEQL